MAYVKQVSSEKSISTVTAAEQLLLEAVYNNGARTIGTELEVFVVKQDGGLELPASLQELSKITTHLCELMEEKGHRFTVNREPLEDGFIINRVGVHGLGTFCFEPGGQFEMAVDPAQDADEAGHKLKQMHDLLEQATTKEYGFCLITKGHHPAFSTPDVRYPRTRFTALYRYYDDVLGDQSVHRRCATNSCSGLQVNLDAGAKDFHEFQTVLTVLDPVLGLMTSNGPRKRIMQGPYNQKFPQQTLPLVEALGSNSPDETVQHIVKRLCSIPLPLQPDPKAREGFVSTRDAEGRYPTIGQMINSGEMKTSSFLTSLSQQIYGGNLRGNGSVLETRAPDSVDVMTAKAVIPLYSEAVYNDDKRSELLALFRNVDQKSLAGFLTRAVQDPFTIKPSDNLDDNHTVQKFVSSILECVADRPVVELAGYRHHQRASMVAVTYS